MEENLQAQARIMEPIYRMIKLAEEKDGDDAKILGALAAQYISDNYKNKALTYGDVQAVLRAVLLYYKKGMYYSGYLANELQVKVAGWVTVLAADLPITIGTIGELANSFADWLADKNALELNATQVMEYLYQQVAFDVTLTERMRLNQEYYYQEVLSILGK